MEARKNLRYFPFLVILVALCGWALLGSPSPAYAHNMDLTTSFSDFTSQQWQHEDADPWKGWANIEVTNTGTEPWGDFHFEIYQVPGHDPIDDVSFIVDPPYEPYTEPARPLTWDVDNDVVGATLDLYFYNNPVAVNDTVTFHVWTDNTVAQADFFGLLIYPTPVPEPATLLLLGLAGLAIRRRRP
jgi:hypothetical protein